MICKALDFFTLEKLSEYMWDVTPLVVHYAWRLRKNEGLDYAEILNRRTWLVPRVLCDIDAEKAALYMRVEEIIEQYLDAQDSSALEMEVREAAWPLLEKIMPSLYEYSYAQPLKKSINGFSWEIKDGVDSPFLTLHFRNWFMPESPFAHCEKLNSALRQIVRVVKNENPEVKIVHCGSWLNDVKAFYALFPDFWRENAIPSPHPTGDMGTWGQMMDRNGCLSRRAESLLRQKGEFAFRAYTCSCGIDELSRFLGQP